MIQQFINNNVFDELFDEDFSKLYEQNTGNAWLDTISPISTAKPNTMNSLKKNYNNTKKDKIY